MFRGIPLPKPYVNLHLHMLNNLLDINELKKGFKKDKYYMNPNNNVHYCIIGCHGNALLHLV